MDHLQRLDDLQQLLMLTLKLKDFLWFPHDNKGVFFFISVKTDYKLFYCADLFFWEIFSKRSCPFTHQLPISKINGYFNRVKTQAQISKCMPATRLFLQPVFSSLRALNHTL